MSVNSPNKYVLYENSVQSVDTSVEFVAGLYKEIHGKEARLMREDFCGTFLLSCSWVKKHPENEAIGIDLDPEPLKYGKENHLSKLKPAQQKRLKLSNTNVLKSSGIKSELIIAFNFSFFIFKKRQELLNYFKACYQSLKPKGIVVLELAGGPGMIVSLKETKTVTYGKDKKCKYIWDQKSFDPIQQEGMYAIHFKLPDGTSYRDAFVYDWRLWSIPEVREILAEAGFPLSHVYWESSHKGEGTGEYVQSEKGDNAYAWIAYVVGVKN